MLWFCLGSYQSEESQNKEQKRQFLLIQISDSQKAYFRVNKIKYLELDSDSSNKKLSNLWDFCKIVMSQESTSGDTQPNNIPWNCVLFESIVLQGRLIHWQGAKLCKSEWLICKFVPQHFLINLLWHVDWHDKNYKAIFSPEKMKSPAE